MDFRFSNLLGTVYRRGNVCFTSDGFQLISPVGNRITVFDLRHDRSHTLQLEASHDIEHLALSPDNALLLAVDCKGEAHLVAMATGAAIARQRMQSRVSALAYSPDGSYFAVARDNRVHVYYSPGLERYFNQFKLYRSYYGNRDEVTAIAWSSNSQAFVCASRDLQVRVFSLHKTPRLPGCYSLGGFTEDIVSAAFLPDSLSLIAVSSAGLVMLWHCDAQSGDLAPPSAADDAKGAVDNGLSSSEDEEADDAGDAKAADSDGGNAKLASVQPVGKLRYLKPKKMRLREDVEDSKRVSAGVTCAWVCGATQLVCGTEDGRVMLYTVENCALLLSLQVCDAPVDSVALSPDGLWIAAASGTHGQLLVWDWRASAYVMRQAGSFNCLSCAAFSPDGGQLACGYTDGRVRLWSTQSSLSFATMAEQTSAITGVRFCGRRVVIASSADGSIRAWDLGRYRNFRTLVSPTPVQLSCLDCDPSGDLIAAGCLDEFHLLLWSLKTGRLLVTLTGHSAPVSAVAFRPGAGATVLASGSWDGTVRLWDVLGSEQQPEVVQCGHDVLAVAWRPDGQQLAVSVNSGAILVMDAVPSGGGEVPEFQATRSIDCRHDLGYDKPDGVLISGRRLAEAGGGFDSLAYSPTGQLLLAGGRSKHLCLYSPGDQVLLRKFPITANRSLGAVALEREAARLMRDLGRRANQQARGTDIALADSAADSADARVSVSGVAFSPAGDMFLAACTEGLLLYCSPGSRHLLPCESLVASCRQLRLGDTPDAVHAALTAGRFGEALDVALRINQAALVRACLAAIPPGLAGLLCQQLPLDTCRSGLAGHLADLLADSSRLEHCLLWARAVARTCCLGQSATARQRREAAAPELTRLHRAVGERRRQLERICSGNLHSLEYLCHLAGCAPVADGDGGRPAVATSEPMES